MGELKNHFDARDVYRKEWAFLKTKEEVEAACHTLTEKGWLKENTVSEGGKTKKNYLINPKITLRR
jgi:hypothetical protein